MRNLSRFLTLLGIILLTLGAYFTFLRFDSNLLSFSSYQYQDFKQTANTTPVSLSIPSVQINLLVFPATITNNQWETTTHGLSYLTISPVPGNRGNSIIYGHNWDILFGNLVKVKPGNQVVIHYSNKSVKKFKIMYTSIVSPDDVSILKPSTDNRVTLYTCTGFLDSKRFVAVALLQQ